VLKGFCIEIIKSLSFRFAEAEEAKEETQVEPGGTE
jgi:hypothetical protein